jgi:hypothetical protein
MTSNILHIGGEEKKVNKVNLCPQVGIFPFGSIFKTSTF